MRPSIAQCPAVRPTGSGQIGAGRIGLGMSRRLAHADSIIGSLARCWPGAKAGCKQAMLCDIAISLCDVKHVGTLGEEDRGARQMARRN